MFYLGSFLWQCSLWASAHSGEVMMLVLEQWLPADGVPHCLLLSRMDLQSSDQDVRHLWEGLMGRCLLWQAVNKMCSHVGLGSTPDHETQLHRHYITNIHNVLVQQLSHKVPNEALEYNHMTLHKQDYEIFHCVCPFELHFQTYLHFDQVTQLFFVIQSLLTECPFSCKSSV